MKQIFILATALIMVFAIMSACKKRDRNDVHCYICARHDSIVETITPHIIVKPIIYDTLCHQTDVSIQYYILTHTNKVADTLHRGDTVAVEYFNTDSCAVP